MTEHLKNAKEWIHENLFPSVKSSILTIVFMMILYTIISHFLTWGIFNGVLHANSQAECVAINPDGACWATIPHHFGILLFGLYPKELYIRPIIAFILIIVAFIPWFTPRIPHRKQLLLISIVIPFISMWIIYGGLGIEKITSDYVGGFLLNLIVGLAAMILSIPFGTMLALGRRSDLPIIKYASVGFIEFIRGVPIISLLFVAVILIKDFLPDWIQVTETSAVIFIFIIFTSVYIAEVLRGGLQAIPKGQYEAAEALGLSYWQRARFITLPQAFAISIPNIVNTFVNMFLDVTLVSIVGLHEILGIGLMTLSDSKWQGSDFEIYTFVAVVFFVICFSITRFSLYLEIKSTKAKNY